MFTEGNEICLKSLQTNVSLNFKEGHQIEHLDLRNFGEFVQKHREIDLFLISELLFFVEIHQSLLDFIEIFLSERPQAHFFLLNQERDETVLSFINTILRKKKWRVTVETLLKGPEEMLYFISVGNFGQYNSSTNSAN